MARNIEIKARVSDSAGLRDRVAAISPAAPLVLIQRDTFYRVPSGRLKLREFSDRTAELIYYQRPDQSGPKTSTYTVTPVPDPASMHELLGGFLEQRAVVAKRRELFMVAQTRIHLDEVEGLGVFLELEVVLADGQPESEGEAIASALMTKLGIRPEDLVEQAYVDLLEGRLAGT